MPVRIGVDFDGVLADTQGFVIRFLAEHLGVDIDRTDFAWRDGRPAIDADLGDETGQGFQAFAANPDYIARLDPVPGARRTLWELAADDRYELVLATHRPGAVHDAIDAWLATNDLPDLDSPASVPDTKARTRPSLDALVDDYHGHADAATDRGLLGIHLTAAWHSGAPTQPGTVRAASWADVLAALRGRTDAG